jgi:hypothetical protein
MKCRPLSLLSGPWFLFPDLCTAVSCLLAGVHDWYRAQFMRKNVASYWWGVWYELPLDIYVKPLISLAYSFPWWMYDCLQGYDLWLHPILLLFLLHWKWHYNCFITLHVLGELCSEITLVFPNWFWSPWSSVVSDCHGFYGMLLSVVLTMYSSLLYRLQIHTLNNEFENLTFILCFLHVEQSLNESHIFSLLTIFKSSLALTLPTFPVTF